MDEFFEARLKECDEKRKAAAMEADYKAFEHWDKEHSNYIRMKEAWEAKTKS